MRNRGTSVGPAELRDWVNLYLGLAFYEDLCERIAAATNPASLEILNRELNLCRRHLNDEFQHNLAAEANQYVEQFSGRLLAREEPMALLRSVILNVFDTFIDPSDRQIYEGVWISASVNSVLAATVKLPDSTRIAYIPILFCEPNVENWLDNGSLVQIDRMCDTSVVWV